MSNQVRLLGQLQFFDGGSWHSPPANKPLGLLGYLACQEGWVDREWVAFLFWPDSGSEQARANLRRLLSRSRRLRFVDSLESETNRLRWPVESDVKSFRQAVARGEWARAVSLYRGELFGSSRFDGSGEFSSWLEMERAGLREDYRVAVFHRVDELQQLGRGHEGIVLLRSLLAADPYDEPAAQRLMRLLSDEGRAYDAIRAYREFRERLAEGLGLTPSSATEKLATALETVSPPPPEAVRTSQADASALTVSQVHSAASDPLQVAPLTSFHGREPELTELTGLLSKPECRLVTVTGVAGVGKTRVGLRAVERLRDRFRDGAVFVPLEAAAGGDDIATEVARALAMRLVGDVRPLEQVRARLSGSEMLLALDNFEHLQEWGELLLELLKGCPELKLLVTSRERLNLAEEWLLPLAGLRYPTEPVDDEELLRSEAISFFLQRCRQVSPSLRPDGELGREALRLCKTVDGLPLALELAAPWVRVMSVAQIAEELEKDLDFFAGGRSLPDRHRSIGAAFGHSWRLLSAKEQESLRRLSVFRGGFDRHAAGFVADANIAVLAGLVDKSLLNASGDGRYGWHPLLHRFCRDLLAQEPKLETETRDRHARFYLAALEDADIRFDATAEIAIVDRVGREYDNVRSALEWFLSTERSTQAMALAASLHWFWNWHGMIVESREWMRKVLALPGGGDGRARARVLLASGVKAGLQGELETAQTYLLDCLELAREEKLPALVAHVHSVLATYAAYRGDFELAMARARECLSNARKAGDATREAMALYDLAQISRFQKRCRDARAFVDDGLRVADRANDVRSKAYLLDELGLTMLDEGLMGPARSVLGDELQMTRDSGSRLDQSRAQLALGLVTLRSGDVPGARPLLLAALRGHWESAALLFVVESLEAVAELLVAEGEPLPAAFLVGAVDRFRSDSRTLPPPNLRDAREAWLAPARERAGEGTFDSAWDQGERLPLERIVEAAITGSWEQAGVGY